MEIAGVHIKLDKETKDYVAKKIGELDRYAPRNSRESLHAEVKLKEQKSKSSTSSSCEVIIFLPHGQITVLAKGENLLSAIDQAESKLKIQLNKYKEKHDSPRLHRRLTRFIKRNN